MEKKEVKSGKDFTFLVWKKHLFFSVLGLFRKFAHNGGSALATWEIASVFARKSSFLKTIKTFLYI